MTPGVQILRLIVEGRKTDRCHTPPPIKNRRKGTGTSVYLEKIMLKNYRDMQLDSPICDEDLGNLYQPVVDRQPDHHREDLQGNTEVRPPVTSSASGQVSQIALDRFPG